MTHGEHLDFDRFKALGVIDSVRPRPQMDLDLFLKNLSAVFMKEETSKEEIVGVLRSYLPNFLHEEKNKNLDQKM